MKKTKLKSFIMTAIVFALCLFCLAGCNNENTANESSNDSSGSAEQSSAPVENKGGVLYLKVNPEIAISYDENGNVTKIESRNDDAKKIIENYSGFEGKNTKEVVSELVKLIGDAGYLVEEVEGEKRTITIEIENGSKMPNDTFIDDVANEIRKTVNGNSWTSPVDIKGESDYGMTDYVDTDYGEGNDGVTDYDDNSDSNYGDSVYDDITDSNYGDSVYDDVTDSNYGDTVYDDVTDSNYGDSVYDTTSEAVNDSNYGDTVYDDGNSNYGNNGDSNYEGGSNYDDGESDYDD